MTRIGTCLALALVGMGTPAVAQTVGANAVVVNDVRMATQAEPQIHQARQRPTGDRPVRV